MTTGQAKFLIAVIPVLPTVDGALIQLAAEQIVGDTNPSGQQHITIALDRLVLLHVLFCKVLSLSRGKRGIHHDGIKLFRTPMRTLPYQP
jgi:hypothetical protein